MKFRIEMKDAAGHTWWEEYQVNAVSTWYDLVEWVASSMKEYWRDHPEGPVKIWTRRYRVLLPFRRRLL